MEQNELVAASLVQPEPIEVPTAATQEGVFEIRDFTNVSSFERLTHQTSLLVKRWVAQLAGRAGDSLSHISVAATDSPAAPVENGVRQMRETFEHLGFQYEVLFQLVAHDSSIAQGGASPPPPASGALERVPSLPAASVERLGLHTFPKRAHRLQRWFGVQHFVVLGVSEHPIDIDSARTVLSALTLGARHALATGAEALRSLGLAPLCCFVPVEGLRRRRYVGERLCGGLRTVFATDQRGSVEPSLEHLAGLLDFFKQRMGVDLDAPGQTVTIGARFTYLADAFDAVDYSTGASGSSGSSQGTSASNAVTSARPASCDEGDRSRSRCEGGEEATEGARLDGTEDGTQASAHEGAGREAQADDQPFFAPATEGDPVESMQLHCLWPSFPRGAFVDNAVYSELDPRIAPYWRLRVLAAEGAPLPLTKLLRNLLDFRKEARTVRSAEHSVQTQMPKTALGSLTFVIQESLESILLPSAGEMADLVAECASRPIAGPAGPAPAPAPAWARPAETTVLPTWPARPTWPALTSLAALHGGARGTRLCRIARVGAEMRCFKGAVMLWCQVLAQMRQQWDTIAPMPFGADLPRTARRRAQGTRAEYFDDSSCLMQQKFEMLQRSIEARRSRTTTTAQCAAPTELMSASGQPVLTPPLLIPALFTQDMALQRLLSAAGAGAGAGAGAARAEAAELELDGRELRADIAAFRHVNPGASLVDFQRWREEVLGVTNAPFPQEWLAACWDDVVPRAAEDQQLLLFEPEREAEMALHYLENIQGTPMLLQFVRVLFRDVLEELAEGLDKHGSNHLHSLWEHAAAAAIAAFGQSGGGATEAAAVWLGDAAEFPPEDALEAAVAAAEALEAATRLATSVRAKLPGPPGEQLLEPLLAEGEANITSLAERQAVEALLTRSRDIARIQDQERPTTGSIFDALPLAKEFVLLQPPPQTPGAVGGSPGCSKRLYAEIRARQLRLATARGVRLA